MPIAEQVVLYLLLTAASFSIIIFYLLSKRRNAPGALYYGFAALSSFIWCVGYTIEFFALSLEYKFFGVQIQYFFGIPFVPILWLAAAVNYKTSGSRPFLRELVFISVVPVITMILLWTNNAHHLVYETMKLVQSGNFLLIEKKVGFWYYINVAYSYLAMLIGTVILLRSVFRSKDIYRTQLILFLVASVLPWIANLLYLIGMNSFMRVDITPIGFACSTVLIGFAVLKYGLFEIVPAAHQLVIESMNNGLIVLDTQNRIVDINPAMRNILGKSNALGSYLKDVFKEINADFEIPGSDLHQTEIEIGGQTFDLAVSAVYDKHRNIAGRILNFYNITERKKSEKELRDLNSAKDKLFSIIAHDLKNPFFGIIGFSEILYEDYNELNDEERKKFAKDINELADNTHKMLENLLEWSRQQTGRIEFNPKNFDVTPLIHESINAACHQSKIKKIKINSSLSETINVRADQNMINTVIRNLLSNAVKFTMPGGHIEVSAAMNGTKVFISIKDNGVGMDEDTLKRLFNINDAIKSSGTFGEKGTGLGLILCKEFVERNGGSISVQSILDNGSTFTFSIPTVN
ncbi:MAG: PAS domain-containing protein [Ignavibacteriales bacterium]|nr:PAS domain-containing protein [Ignavibacteriales bacterium]